MTNLRRLVSTILALALALVPGLAHAGQGVARTAPQQGAGIRVVAPVVLPSVNLGTNLGVGTLPSTSVGVPSLPSVSVMPGMNVPAPGATTLPTGRSEAPASSVQPAPATSERHSASVPGGSVVAQGAAQAVGQAAAGEAGAAAAVQTFKQQVAGQKTGTRVSRVADSILGWLKPKKTEPIAASAGAPVYAMAHDGDSTSTAPLAPSSASTDDGSSNQEPPAPTPPGGGSSEKAAWRNATMFIVGLVVAQVGVEAWSASWAKWVQVNYGLDAYSTLTMIGMVVSLAAGYAGGWAADKFGLKKTYIASIAAVIASAGATLALFHMGGTAMLTLPVLIGLAAFRTFVSSAGRTAEQTIPIAIFKDHKAALEKYNSVAQFILEFAGIGVPFAIGALLATFGSLGTMALLPATALLAGLVFAFVKMGEVQKQKANLVGPKKPEPALLKIGMMAYPAVALLNFLLYAILAIGYGNYLHPGSLPIDQAAAAGVAGKIVALYSVGGLIAAGMLSGLPATIWAWVKKKFPGVGRKADALFAPKPEPQTADEARAASLRGVAKWMILSAVSLVAFVPLLWTSATLASLAMIPFGIANVMSTLQLLSLVQRNAPAEKKGKVMGGLRTITTLVSTAGFFGFTRLFKMYPGSATPFLILLGVLAAVGVYYWWIARKLKSQASNPAP